MVVIVVVAVGIATVGLGVSDFGHRIFAYSFRYFMHGFGIMATWSLRKRRRRQSPMRSA